jgi:hypothetical protein
MLRVVAWLVAVATAAPCSLAARPGRSRIRSPAGHVNLMPFSKPEHMLAPRVATCRQPSLALARSVPRTHNPSVLMTESIEHTASGFFVLVYLQIWLCPQIAQITQPLDLRTAVFASNIE